MADSFFGFDTSLSNFNDDEGGGGPSEDEYDALNDETFGQDGDEFDWEVEHEHLAHQLESSRRNNSGIDDDANTQLEASLSQLVLDETDASHSAALGSSVWRHDPLPVTSTPGPTLPNVCTVEELERQIRQKQQMNQHQNFPSQNFFQPRYPPMILQRPPGLQAPVPLPFAPQQTVNHNMNQMNQPLNKIIGQNNQMGQNHQMMNNHLNQFQPNMNQGNMLNQMQMKQMQSQMGHNMSQMGQNMNQIGPNVNHMPQNMNQMGQNTNQMGQNMNQMGHNTNQMGPNINQMGPNVNQMGQNVNQMVPNSNQFGQSMNQFPHMMGQPRMMAPPPGINMPMQNFNPNMGQYNPNFRGPSMQSKPEQQSQLNQQNIMQMKSQPQQINQNIVNNIPNQSPPKRIDPKNQKNRGFNNKNMTSQNLVQLIQNTHPMLQYNSFHNANHHPILNRNTFNNNQLANNHPMFNNQRVNGNFNNNNRIMTNGDDSSSSVNADPHAGLMSSREKQWLLYIQLLQLNTGTPYLHDYYYTVFLERQSQKEKEGVKEAHKANQQNHPFYSNVNKQEQHTHQRERHNSNRHNSTSEDGATPRTYVPLQFENSLGKLQCGSVTAPRKIIDVEVVSNSPPPLRGSRAPSQASVTNPHEVPREVKRTKQLLLEIEALYLILLRLEELNDPLAIANALILKEREEKQKLLEAAQKEAEQEQDEDSNVFLRNIESVQRRPKQDSPKSESVDKRQVVNLAMNQKPAPVKNLLDEDKEDLLGKIFSSLLHADRLPQLLAVRKGRKLVARLAEVAGACGAWRGVWTRALRAAPALCRREHELALLARPLARYIQNSTGWSYLLECCCILSEALDPARTPYILTSTFTMSCISAIVEKASTLTNTPEATPNERQYFKFLKTVARALKNTSLSVASPIKPLSEKKLIIHLKQLESRSTVEILQRGKTTTEFSDLSKTDINEQLVKHLC